MKKLKKALQTLAAWLLLPVATNIVFLSILWGDKVITAQQYVLYESITVVAIVSITFFIYHDDGGKK